MSANTQASVVMPFEDGHKFFSRRTALDSIGVGLAIFLLSQWCYRQDLVVQPSLNPLCPVSGFALAALLVGGIRLLPAIPLGIALSRLLLGMPPDVWIPGALQHTLAAFAGWALVRRMGVMDLAFRSLRDLLLFFVFGILMPSAVFGAAVAVTHLAAIGSPPHPAWSLGLLASARYALGLLVFCPFFVFLLSGDLSLPPKTQRAAWLGGMIGLTAAIYAIFHRPPDYLPGMSVEAYLLYPLVVCFALYFDLRLMSAALVTIFTLVSLFTAAGLGPFAAGEALTTFTDQSVYLTILSATGYLLAVSRDDFRLGEQRVHIALRTANLGLWEWSAYRGLIYYDEDWAHRFGMRAGQPLPVHAVMSIVHPDDRKRALAEQFDANGRSRDAWITELRLVDRKGRAVPVRIANKIVGRDRAGKASHIIGVTQDRTEEIASADRLVTGARREAELLALRSQMHPHFLFNCLNSIRALIRLNPDDARAAVDALAGLLRASLRSGNHPLVTLDDELTVVRDYLKLESFRYAGRLQVRMEIDPGTRSALIPPLLLQTLVENAVQHGIARSKIGGEILLQTFDEGRCCRIRLQNPGELSIQQAGLGIENTRQRLAVLDGEGTMFSLSMSGPQTVVAEIVLPSFFPES